MHLTVNAEVCSDDADDNPGDLLKICRARGLLIEGVIVVLNVTYLRFSKSSCCICASEILMEPLPNDAHRGSVGVVKRQAWSLLGHSTMDECVYFFSHPFRRQTNGQRAGLVASRMRTGPGEAVWEGKGGTNIKPSAVNPLWPSFTLSTHRSGADHSGGWWDWGWSTKTDNA